MIYYEVDPPAAMKRAIVRQRMRVVGGSDVDSSQPLTFRELITDELTGLVHEVVDRALVFLRRLLRVVLIIAIVWAIMVAARADLQTMFGHPWFIGAPLVCGLGAGLLVFVALMFMPDE